MVCKGICSDYKVKKNGNRSRYLDGQKWCPTCAYFTKWEGLFCPCCGYKLRANPRCNRNKKILRKKMMIEVVTNKDHHNTVSLN